MFCASSLLGPVGTMASTGSWLGSGLSWSLSFRSDSVGSASDSSLSSTSLELAGMACGRLRVSSWLAGSASDDDSLVSNSSVEEVLSFEELASDDDGCGVTVVLGSSSIAAGWFRSAGAVGGVSLTLGSIELTWLVGGCTSFESGWVSCAWMVDNVTLENKATVVTAILILFLNILNFIINHHLSWDPIYPLRTSNLSTIRIDYDYIILFILYKKKLFLIKMSIIKAFLNKGLI